MKVLVSWLQDYIKEELPPPKELAEALSLRAFEVEDIKGSGKGAVIDVDVLPNRANDCLSHRGIAREISAFYGFTFKEREIEATKREKSKVSIKVKDPELCRRYIALPVSNVRVGPSPKWLKERLEAIGERSINNIVDITNYVMFDTGQPLHAFDRAKLKGDEIHVRLASPGEKMTTLDNNKIELIGTELVIADKESILALAGVKGGKKAEVDKKTTDIILEAASFDPVCVRRTSRRINILTESSKRFENNPSPEYALHAAELAQTLISELLISSKNGSGPEASANEPVDFYPEPVRSRIISLPVSEIRRTLGIDIPIKDSLKILERLYCKAEVKGEVLKVEPPIDRHDLNIPEDIIEEIGRVYGYEHLKTTPLKPIEGEVDINKSFYYQIKIRLILRKLGFSEIFTYSIRDKGPVELANPLTQDKRFLRDEIGSDMEVALTFNERNIELVGYDRVCLFEIANVFTPSEEKTHFVIGVKNTKKKQKPGEEELIKQVLSVISVDLGIDIQEIGSFVSSTVWEGCLDDLVDKLPKPEKWDIEVPEAKEKKYRKISPYPFVLRDIAVFVPAEIKSDEVLEMIEGNAGSLLKTSRLFDVYEKIDESGEKRASYAFRLVFLSHERTLADHEVNKIMDKVSSAINSKKGWQVR